MDCPEEVAGLPQAVGSIVGGDHRLSFAIVRRRTKVDVEGLEITAATVFKAVAKAGMRAEL